MIIIATLERTVIPTNPAPDREDKHGISHSPYRRHRSASILRQSKSTNQRSMSLPCHLCQRVFARSGNLENHLTKSHLAAMEPPADGPRLPAGAEHRESTPLHLDEAEDAPFDDDGPAPTNIEVYPDAGRPLSHPRIDFQYSDVEIYAPFDNLIEYKLASWAIRNNLSKTCCEEYFKNGLASPLISLTSVYGVRKKIEEMGVPDSIKFIKKRVDWGIPRRNASDFWYRDIIECAAYLLRQPAYARDAVWTPVKETNAHGNRLYSEMHTADWWWEQQVFKPSKLSSSRLTSV